MVELRSKKSYDVSNTTSGASTEQSKGVTRKPRSVKLAVVGAKAEIHAAEVTSPKRRATRQRKASDDEAMVDDQNRVASRVEPVVEAKAAMQAPTSPKAKGVRGRPKAVPKTPAAAVSSPEVAQPVEAVKSPKKPQPAAAPLKEVAQPKTPKAGKAQPKPAFSITKVLVAAVLALTVVASIYVASQPELQQQLSTQLNTSVNAARAKLHTLPYEFHAWRTTMQQVINDRALQAKEMFYNLKGGAGPATAEPILSADRLSEALNAEQVWQDRIADIMAHSAASSRAESPKALGIMLTCTPEFCQAAVEAVAAASVQPECVLPLIDTAFPASDEEASGRLQAQLHDFFTTCPAGLVVLDGVAELGYASVNVLHSALSEHGSLLHMGRHISTSRGTFVLVMPAELGSYLADEQGFEAVAREQLRDVLQESFSQTPNLAKGAAQAFTRRIDFVLPAAEWEWAEGQEQGDVPAEEGMYAADELLAQ